MYHQKHLPHHQSLQEQNRLLIYQCFNVLNHEAELSGPQVMSYFMGWGDQFVSHQYAAVCWGQLARAQKDFFCFLEDGASIRREENHTGDGYNHVLEGHDSKVGETTISLKMR